MFRTRSFGFAVLMLACGCGAPESYHARLSISADAGGPTEEAGTQRDGRGAGGLAADAGNAGAQMTTASGSGGGAGVSVAQSDGAGLDGSVGVWDAAPAGASDATGDVAADGGAAGESAGGVGGTAGAGGSGGFAGITGGAGSEAGAMGAADGGVAGQDGGPAGAGAIGGAGGPSEDAGRSGDGEVDGAYDPYDPRRWTAKASVSAAADPPAHAIDGQATTRWSTGRDQVGGEWFQIDLGAVLDVSELWLDGGAAGTDFPPSFSMWLSTDGVSWKFIRSGNGAPITRITFTRQKARYFKIVQNSMSTRWWSIYEATVKP